MKRIITEPIKIQSKDGTITGQYLESGKVQINAGSFFRNIEVNSLRANVHEVRSYLINNNYIFRDQLSKDYVFDNPSIAISALMGHMETGNQAFITLDNIELGTYLDVDEVIGTELKEALSRKLIDEDDKEEIITSTSIDGANYEEVVFKPEPLPELIDKETRKFKRDPLKAKRAIVYSNYKCNIDNFHKSFMTKRNFPYMEAHHLIPLSAQDQFDVSLDVEANIVCLCPNCHKRLHYGKDIKGLLLKLYDYRVGFLKESGIDISFETLIKLYN